MSAAHGSGLLSAVLEDACRELRCTRNRLTVLSARIDPYRLDTPAGHRDGAWVAEQLNREIIARRTIHWRGLHYVIVSLGNVSKPNGQIYRNTDDDWTWLSENAGKAARWLGYVDFERIKDNRNSAPIIHRKARVTAHPYTSVIAGHHVDIPDVSVSEPWAHLGGFEREQPFSLAIFGEKASLEDVVSPLARYFEADLYLPQGEISTRCSSRWRRTA